MRAFVERAARGAHPNVRLEMDVVLVGVVEEVCEGNEAEGVVRVYLESAAGDDRVGPEEEGESWRARRRGGEREEEGEGSGVVEDCEGVLWKRTGG